MGDALRDRLSDRGSIPLRSIYGTSRKDSIYAAFREFFLLSLLLVDIRKFFADTESDGDRMKKTLLNRKKQNKKSDYYDYNLVAVIVLLVCFGLVMLYSTSSYMAEVNYGNDMFYFKKQALISAACLIGALFISKILDYHILLPFIHADFESTPFQYKLHMSMKTFGYIDLNHMFLRLRRQPAKLQLTLRLESVGIKQD